MQTIFTGGTIITMANGKKVDAVLIDENRIKMTGSLEKCKDAAPKDYNVINLKGKTLLPGFIDTHTHPIMIGMCCIWADLSSPRVKSICDIIAILKQYGESSKRSGPICGYAFNQRSLAERRYPTAADLDKVSKTRHVQIMHASGHCNVVNTKLMHDIGIRDDTPDPLGGSLGRYADGKPNGQLFDSANDFLSGVAGVKPQNHGPNIHMPGNRKDLMKRFEVGQLLLHEAGITTVNEVQLTKQELNTYLRARDEGKLKIRIEMSFLSNYLDDIIKLGFNSTFGDEWLSIGSIKFYSDASLLTGTANVSTGYLDSERRGYQYHEPEELANLLIKAHENRLHTLTHATGDAAVEPIIEGIRWAQTEDPWPEAVHRIEHAGLVTQDQARKMGRLGIIPSTQPEFLYLYGDEIAAAIEGKKGREFMPLARFKKYCPYFTISSGAPVTNPNPMEAISTAVCRRTRKGFVLSPAQCISVEDGLKAYTIYAAKALRRDKISGSIEIGKLADFAILNRNPLSVPKGHAESLRDIKVMETWVNGEKVFQID